MNIKPRSCRVANCRRQQESVKQSRPEELQKFISLLLPARKKRRLFFLKYSSPHLLEETTNPFSLDGFALRICWSRISNHGDFCRGMDWTVTRLFPPSLTTQRVGWPGNGRSRSLFPR